MLTDIKKMGLSNWMFRTFKGNVAVGILYLGVPGSILASYFSYLEKILSLGRIFFVILVCCSAGAIFGMFLWISVSRPLLNSSKPNRRR